MTWIAFTVLAALCQSWRNAFQSQLSSSLSVAGTTLSRFIFASPIALAYLVFLYQIFPTTIPNFTLVFAFYVSAASAMQIVATGLMVLLFKQQNYAIGAGLAKCEAPMSALLGVIFFGTALSFTGWVGVILGTVAVLLLSCSSGWRSLSVVTLALGILCSTAFALTSLWVREASIELSAPFPHSAAWVLLLVITLQTLVICSYIALKERDTLNEMRKKPKLIVMTSLTSVLGSLGWFSAMALQAVPYVKTLGQIEIVFMALISYFWLKQKLKRNEGIALCLIACAAILVMWQQ
ncbi:DMT family transporter [Vibrio agarivorans]|uniref:DMT family transporter n=1 Tax=Vibrio agarivorans TaxID=153622 RepID=UPI0025B29763|nr:DMT family transporter [Vibrio agarivorans]MDN3663444.1 DMT family transporter [Vibrio agarivorans]